MSKTYKFESFLMMEHNKKYTWNDDEAYDMFLRWVENLTTIEKLEYVAEYLRGQTDEGIILLAETFFQECIDN